MLKKINRYLIKQLDNEDVAVENPDYQKQLSKEKYNYFLEKSNIPTFYHSIEFKDYHGSHDSEEFKKIVYYAEHCHEDKFKYVSLYLWGLNSTQKSALSCNIGKQAIRNGLKVKFILAGDLIDDLMKVQGYSKSEEIQNRIDELKDQNLLIIDDFCDIEKSIMWKNSSHIIVAEWDIFLRSAISNGIKFVITSNYDPSSIEQTFNKSLHELIDRNFVSLQLTESVKSKRKLSVQDVFKDV